MAVYVIGDIHGHVDALERLVDQVNPKIEDFVIQLGDCINRGPDSFEVVEYWLNFRRCPYYVLGGNHEEIMFDHLSEGADTLLSMGGGPTLLSYQKNGWECRRGDPSSVPENHFEFYMQALNWTRSLLVTSHYIFSHAGYDFTRDANHQNPQFLRWGSSVGWRPGLPTLVRGHSPHRRVTIEPGCIHVDTGCGMGGALSCISLPSEKVFTSRP